MLQVIARPTLLTHATQLSNGREFITFICLQMVHFGMRDHYQIYKGYEKVILVMDR